MGMQLPKYEIKLCKIQEVADSLHLLEKHWKESARNKSLMKLAPDYALYDLLELSGTLVCLGAYVENLLVGYSVNLIKPHLHYSTLLCGYNDLLFVDDEYRSSPLGLKLIKETKKELRIRGAKLMLWHAKEDTALSSILPRLGCKVQEIIYSEEL